MWISLMPLLSHAHMEPVAKHLQHTAYCVHACLLWFKPNQFPSEGLVSWLAELLFLYQRLLSRV